MAFISNYHVLNVQAASMFKGPVPPIVPFSLGSLGFMTPFCILQHVFMHIIFFIIISVSISTWKLNLTILQIGNNTKNALKHFNWPERKADAIREAAVEYRELKSLEQEISSFKDDPEIPCGASLRKMASP